MSEAALADIPMITISAAGKLLDADHSLRKLIKIGTLLKVARLCRGP